MMKAISAFLLQNWLNVLESLGDGIIVTDRSNRVEFINEDAAQLTGQSGPVVVGRDAGGLLRGNPWLMALLEATNAPRSGRLSCEGSIRGPWREIPVWACAAPLVDESGEQVGKLLILRDLTQRRELENRSRELERLAQLEVLVAGLAHEIKNPLSGMRGAAQILVDARQGDARTRECTQIMVEEIDRLNALLTQLLDLTGTLRMERAAVNIHQLLDRVLTIEGAGRAEAPRFVRHFDPSLPPVWGDSGRLTQVFLNLIRNALEASQPGSPVTLTTRAENGYLAGGHGRGRFLSLDIADQGSGISEDDLPRIFSPFFTTKAGGTGLGLAICQRIVNEHGGLLRVRSVSGEGATFTVTLPVEKALTAE